ncbi:MAG: hypothetical protein A3H98_05370 [Bacteroidetes bacterium RIFCSPLOWO2_02_FULL_36_8]|nr:MAG: hypothetical protein A3H98_05370 [Bacteroidetes bacterium RIFCSPLOWO2_02_FULL_36_8]OFY70305.1 MAG: hypothetical protein A3G23_09220 [Bacteroidetes bacterium RIFCSPLOWO2_12_FULL_37_12]
MAGFGLNAPSAADISMAFGKTGYRYINSVSLSGYFILFMGMAYYMVPKLTGKNMFLGSGFGWALLIVTLLCSLSGVMPVLTNERNLMGFGSSPSFVNELFLVILFLFNLVIIGSVLLREERKLHISLSFLMLSTLWLFLNWIILHWILPWFVKKDLLFQSYSAQWYFTAMLFGFTSVFCLIYFLLPAASFRPLFNARLVNFSFWTLAVFLPAAGLIHYSELSATENFNRTGLIFTVLLSFPLIAVSYSFFSTLQSSWKKVVELASLRYLTVGFILFITLAFIQLFIAGWGVYPTKYIASFGVFNIAPMGCLLVFIIAGYLYVFPRICAHEIYSRKLLSFQSWILLVSLFSMPVLDSLISFTGMSLLRLEISPEKIFNFLNPFIRMHTISLWLGICGVALFLFQIVMTLRKGKPTQTIQPEFKELQFRGREVETAEII